MPGAEKTLLLSWRYLPNEMEELTALTRLQREYRRFSITEMLLNELTTDSLVTLDGFQRVRADTESREKDGPKGYTANEMSMDHRVTAGKFFCMWGAHFTS